MRERVRELALRWLRVPPEPEAPAGGRVIRVFRAAPAFFRYRRVMWALGQAGALVGLVIGLVLLESALRAGVPPVVAWLLRLGEVAAWTGWLAQLLFSLVVLRLDYELRWYILSDRSLRIREGILSVREKTMTFANVQEISIRQNPLQRLLGIADVQVRSAGGGSGPGGKGEVGESMHEAFFRGVDNAEEIRAAIRERVRLHRDAGLGDPDEPPSMLPAAQEAGALPAARELLAEMRGLRREVEAVRAP